VGSIGGSLRVSFVQAVMLFSRHSSTFLASLRQSFEAFHGITGFHKTPNYHIIRCGLQT
jgi:hypothetical protein